MPSFWSRLGGPYTAGAGTGADGGDITERLVLRVLLSTTKVSPFLSKEPLRLGPTSECATHGIAGGVPLSCNPLLDGVSFDKGYPVRKFD